MLLYGLRFSQNALGLRTFELILTAMIFISGSRAVSRF